MRSVAAGLNSPTPPLPRVAAVSTGNWSAGALKPTDAEGRRLRDTVYVDCTNKLFVFLKRRDAEPTNNESERALRPSVIFRKVTNGFRSEWGAKAYADLCSIVETGRRNGRKRSYRHPQRPGSPSARANCTVIRPIRVSNYHFEKYIYLESVGPRTR